MSSNRPTRGAAAAAAAIIAEESTSRVAELGDELFETKQTSATQAARVLSEIISLKPELVVPLTERFTQAIKSENKRVVQTAAEGLPAIARKSPARVAKHLEELREIYEETTQVGKHGLVTVFANLCTASVAYQRRIEPMLTHALKNADGKSLAQWAELVLPALKGEPHANVRAVVESRLPEIEREHAQKIASFLGIRLRTRSRG